ncbi:hypothetical protein RKD38_005911 [Streptomyces ambofaciens]
MLIISQSTGIRGTSLESPACGPAPVTTVPTVISSAETTTITHTSCCTDLPTSGRGAVSPSRVRCHITVASVSSAVVATKWAATVYGLSPTSTTMPPSTALVITTQNCAHPSRVRLRRYGFCERAAMIAQPTAAHST